MSKASFTVGYQLKGQTHVVLGVTSIVPNLNGFLFFTEDGHNHIIENYELNGGECEFLGNMFFEYTDDEGYLEYFQTAGATPDCYKVHDYREKTEAEPPKVGTMSSFYRQQKDYVCGTARLANGQRAQVRLPRWR